MRLRHSFNNPAATFPCQRKKSSAYGELYEHEVIAHIVGKFCDLGFQFCSVSGSYGPFDAILESSEFYIVIVVRREISDEDVDEKEDGYNEDFDLVKELVHSLEAFRLAYDKKGDKRKVYGALAGGVMSDKAKTAVLEAGFYVVVPNGDTVKIDVPEGFVPKAW
jgi:hypothetical protein